MVPAVRQTSATTIPADKRVVIATAIVLDTDYLNHTCARTQGGCARALLIRPYPRRSGYYDALRGGNHTIDVQRLRLLPTNATPAGTCAITAARGGHDSLRVTEARDLSLNVKPARLRRRLSIMIRPQHVLRLAVVLCAVGTMHAQQPDAAQIAQERRQAELDAPKLVEVLELKPGMTVADVGSGFGAMTVVLGHWIGSGRVFATDITERALRQTREYVKKEALTNVTVIEGAEAATNLPDACCDAIFLRNVYHHITIVDAFNKSLVAALKPGGRLAIIDLEDRSGGQIPKGVPANRGGHGVPPGIVVDELKAAGLTHIRTTEKWPPGEPTFLALFRK